MIRVLGIDNTRNCKSEVVLRGQGLTPMIFVKVIPSKLLPYTRSNCSEQESLVYVDVFEGQSELCSEYDRGDEGLGIRSKHNIDLAIPMSCWQTIVNGPTDKFDNCSDDPTSAARIRVLLEVGLFESWEVSPSFGESSVFSQYYFLLRVGPGLEPGEPTHSQSAWDLVHSHQISGTLSSQYHTRIMDAVRSLLDSVDRLA